MAEAQADGLAIVWRKPTMMLPIVGQGRRKEEREGKGCTSSAAAFPMAHYEEHSLAPRPYGGQPRVSRRRLS